MRELTPEELRAVHHGDRPLYLPLRRVTPVEPWPVDLPAAHAASEFTDDDAPRRLPEGGGIVIVAGVAMACIVAVLAILGWPA